MVSTGYFGQEESLSHSNTSWEVYTCICLAIFVLLLLLSVICVGSCDQRTCHCAVLTSVLCPPDMSGKARALHPRKLQRAAQHSVACLNSKYVGSKTIAQILCKLAVPQNAPE